ncbi:hypothetical protein TraAM80_07437 [Trypanosoma rangeli]|uniref:Uncharacterized protein n=1 Tax=Trypanosoma rangeli TaxID=5698 RepID=A0A422N5G0_TRYRA|nr:uncharacterized protein TraAM80_07437 [Trypanosoma rangeli]RNF00704.1 hypothetical protein TraAM80_07437 [Trypanosoma rangeli]|eukprot:RNF00704.1 hypothetical protein TraAM80_07437 [Trypanosoma rangeli]
MRRLHRAHLRLGEDVSPKYFFCVREKGAKLPDPPYALPTSPRFEVERSGTFNKTWLQHELPACKPLVRNSVYLPSKEELWNSPMHEGLEQIAEHLPYHDVLRYIMEHNYFFLFKTLLKAGDAPLPHVVYEDFMKCRTFASLQSPPEEQFALPPTLLRALLCMAAYQCIIDPHYFTTCHLLFRRLEQQQTMSSEVLSAWVYCCAASGRVDDALAYAKHMADHDVPFDDTVFSLMQHPSVNPVAAEHSAVWHSAKGMLLQRRLGGRLQTEYRSDTVAAHGMFVFYALTLSHVKKWEVIRAAGTLGVSLSERTLSLAVEVYAREKGLRCGPKTVRALALFLARDGSIEHLLFVLLRTKKNELLPEFRGLPRTVFSEAEEADIMYCVARRARRDEGCSAVIPLLRALVREDDPQQFFHALTHAVRATNTNSSGGGDNAAGSGVDPTHTSSNEQGLQDLMTSVQGLLREVDALEKASRNGAPRGGAAKTIRASVREEEAGVAELQSLEESNIPPGLRELARMHLVERSAHANRAARLRMAWVNPDGTF